MNKQNEKPDWKTFVMPFGKFEGKTMFMIYHGHIDYLKWLDKCTNLPYDLRNALDGAMEHKNKVDPWS